MHDGRAAAAIRRKRMDAAVAVVRAVVRCDVSETSQVGPVAEKGKHAGRNADICSARQVLTTPGHPMGGREGTYNLLIAAAPLHVPTCQRTAMP